MKNAPDTTPAASQHASVDYRRNNRLPRRRRGTIIVLSAFLMIAMFAMVAFSVDLGYMFTTQTEIQRSVDAAALAGAGVLVHGPNVAQDKAIEFLVRNPVGSRTPITDDELAAKISAFLENHEEDIEIKVGHWNPETGQIEESQNLPSTISVSYALNDHPLFFAPVLGRDTFNVRAESIAMYQPRDIALVLDLSGSMNDDSELGAIDTFGFQAIYDGLYQCYLDLGSPVYGNLEFAPQWITVEGPDPWHSSQPKLYVEYQYEGAKIISDKDFQQVAFRYSNGNWGYYNTNPSHDGGEWTATVDGYRRVDEVYVKTDGQWSSKFDFDSNVIDNVTEEALGLDDVPYPYPSGSWDDFIDYCQASNNANGRAGYKYKYGYLNLINYWLEQKYKQSWTPDLWKVSAQPITAVKDSVDVFMEYIRVVDTEDRVALAVYNAPDGDGLLESELTTDLDEIETLTRHTQAGHYHNYTNIGAGMTVAREEILANGRPGAFKYIVLLTDGQANWVDGGVNSYWARQYVLNEAYLAKEAKIPIVTISLGAGADTDLMQQVADITEGEHFNVPGGQSVDDYQADLTDVFRKIADDRPLTLVK